MPQITIDWKDVNPTSSVCDGYIDQEKRFEIIKNHIPHLPSTFPTGDVYVVLDCRSMNVVSGYFHSKDEAKSYVEHLQ